MFGNVKHIDEAIRGRARRAEGQVEGAATRIQHHSREMTQVATDCIRNHPWTCVAAAVAAGALAGALLQRPLR